jgi:hypothetical protein
MITKTNKRKVEDIDERFLLNSIAEESMGGESPKPSVSSGEQDNDAETIALPLSEKPKEAARRKRNTNRDYGSLFLQKNEFKARQCVYISQGVHSTISEIVRMVANKDITVGGYIDSILIEHLEIHREEIMELYDRELSLRKGKSLMVF